MTINRGLFVRQTGTAPTAVGTTPVQARLTDAALFHEALSGQPKSGVIMGGGSIVNGTTGMNYDITRMGAIINRANDEGVYRVTSSGTTTIATTAAPGTNSRWDLVYVKQNDPDKGDANNSAIFGVVQGTAAASPTKPYADAAVAAGSGALVLAEIQVFSGTVNTNALTVTNVYTFAGLRGAVLPVANVTDRGLLSSTSVGMAAQRLDVNPSCVEYISLSGSWFSAGLGMVARAKVSADPVAVGAGPAVDSATYIASFKFIAGRRYRIEWSGQFLQTAASTQHVLQICSCSTADSSAATTGLTVLGEAGHAAVMANIAQAFFCRAIYEPAADTTVQLKGVISSRTTGAGNWQSKATSSAPIWFAIFDEGDAF